MINYIIDYIFYIYLLGVKINIGFFFMMFIVFAFTDKEGKYKDIRNSYINILIETPLHLLVACSFSWAFWYFIITKETK